MGGLALILLKFQVNNPKGCQLMELPPRDRGGPNYMQTKEPNEKEQKLSVKNFEGITTNFEIKCPKTYKMGRLASKSHRPITERLSTAGKATPRGNRMQTELRETKVILHQLSKPTQ